MEITDASAVSTGMVELGKALPDLWCSHADNMIAAHSSLSSLAFLSVVSTQLRISQIFQLPFVPFASVDLNPIFFRMFTPIPALLIYDQLSY